MNRSSVVADDDVIAVSDNSLPTRPLSVSFQPEYFLPACDVFDALQNADACDVFDVLQNADFQSIDVMWVRCFSFQRYCLNLPRT